MNDAIDELEESVIGAVLVRPETLALLPSLETDDYRSLRGKATWEAIRNLEASGQHIDVNTVAAELGNRGKLDAVGWAWLGLCAVRLPTEWNAIEYARRLRDAAIKRRIQLSLAELLEESKHGMSGAEMLSATLAAVSTLDSEQADASCDIGDVIKRRVRQLEQVAQDRLTGVRTLTGYPTGVVALDEKIGGWQPGIVSIVAARPAMGKSSLGLATADACSKAGFGVHLFSLEDTEAAYADRSLSRTSGVVAESIRNAELSAVDMENLRNAMRDLARRKGWLVDGRSGITADEIVRSVRRKKRDNKTCVVIVDYVQLVKRYRNASAHEALSEIMTAFSDAAKHDNVAYVVMSQLNRELEKREDRRPQMSDLRESGSLEERAKCIVALYRGVVYSDTPKPKVDYNPETQTAPSKSEFARQVQLHILKNSNGRTGRVFATWNGPTTRIE